MRMWVRLVFGLSLMLNLLVGGIVVGGFLANERRGPPPERFDFGLGPLGMAFSVQDRRQMREEAERAGANFGQMRGDLRSELTALLDVLAADPWDPQAVQHQMERMRANTTRRVLIGESIMLQHLNNMTPDQRKAYVERLRSRLPELRDKPEKR